MVTDVKKEQSQEEIDLEISDARFHISGMPVEVSEKRSSRTKEELDSLVKKHRAIINRRGR